MTPLNMLQEVLIYAIPILFAITVHEVAHGWVANKLGDSTARILGRLTLNPFKHIDLVGTILVPLMLFYFGGFLFGWAKPVPVNWNNLHHPRRDLALVSVSGPLVNLFMGILWGLIARGGILIDQSGAYAGIAIEKMGMIGIQINLVLMVLNLIPIPPLDGSRVISSLLPKRLARLYSSIEPFGFFILVLLLAFGVLSNWITPLVITLQNQISGIFGL